VKYYFIKFNKLLDYLLLIFRKIRQILEHIIQINQTKVQAEFFVFKFIEKLMRLYKIRL
jgi:hypothetical protein